MTPKLKGLFKWRLHMYMNFYAGLEFTNASMREDLGYMYNNDLGIIHPYKIIQSPKLHNLIIGRQKYTHPRINLPTNISSICTSHKGEGGKRRKER